MTKEEPIEIIGCVPLGGGSFICARRQIGWQMSAVAAAELSRWKCHKEVWAEKIKKVQPEYGQLILEDSRFIPIPVGIEFIERHNPQAGGYYVVYDDGYRSYSPAEPFESGYTKVS